VRRQDQDDDVGGIQAALQFVVPVIARMKVAVFEGVDTIRVDQSTEVRQEAITPLTIVTRVRHEHPHGPPCRQGLCSPRTAHGVGGIYC
jgi:hypothetical protein